MILFVKDGCPFCEKFMDMPGLMKAKVVGTTENPTIEINSGLTTFKGPLPVAVPAFPALLDGATLYIGISKIEERLMLERVAG